jgi:hypothetical protein
MRLLAILVAVFAVSVEAAAAAAGSVVRGDVQIGRYLVKRDGTLGGAILAFGQPSSLRRRDITCLARWSGLGVRISFYNLGGQNPCQGRYGYFGEGIITGRGWATGKGLRIGDPARRVSALYGRHRVTGAWAWLLTRRSPFGDGGVYAALSARIQSGRVTAFRVKYQAGGD